MTETTRRTECNAPGATLYLAFELGSTKWVLAFTTSPAQRPRHRQVVAGDLQGLLREVLTAKVRFGLPLDALVRVVMKPAATGSGCTGGSCVRASTTWSSIPRASR